MDQVVEVPLKCGREVVMDSVVMVTSWFRTGAPTDQMVEVSFRAPLHDQLMVVWFRCGTVSTPWATAGSVVVVFWYVTRVRVGNDVSDGSGDEVYIHNAISKKHATRRSVTTKRHRQIPL